MCSLPLVSSEDGVSVPLRFLWSSFHLFWLIECSGRAIIEDSKFGGFLLSSFGAHCHVGMLRLDCWMVRGHFQGRMEILTS